MMNQYLSNIAARNTGNETNVLLPSTPVFNDPGIGISQDHSEANDLQDDALQIQPFQQSIIPAQPVATQKNKQNVVLNETVNDFTQEHTESSYFSRHVERMETEKESSPVKDKVTETVKFKFDEVTLPKTIENTEARLHVNEEDIVYKSVSKIIPEKKDAKKQTSGKPNKKQAEISLKDSVPSDEIMYKEKQVIQPADKTEVVQNIKINSPQKIRIDRIIPIQPDQLNEKPVQNSKVKETAPKLVIGKIIVEILPPKLPAPQKVITRVVQSPAKDSYSKSNKLIFGLRQL